MKSISGKVFSVANFFSLQHNANFGLLDKCL